MKYIRSLDGQNTPYIMPLPVANSTSDVLKGVPVIAAGVTVAGSVTVATATSIAKVVGLTTEKYTYASSNVYSLSIATTAFSEILVDIRPFGIAESVVDEVGSGQKIAGEEAVGQTAIALTAITADDDFNSCWFYEDGTEQLRYVTDSANSGEEITVAALTTLIAANVTPAFTPPRLSESASLYRNLTGTDTNRKVKYDGLITTYNWAYVLDNHIIPITGSGKKLPKERLIPWKHDSATTSSAELSTQFAISDHVITTQ